MTLEIQSFTTSVFGIFFGMMQRKKMVAFLEDGAKFRLAIADIFPQNLEKMVHLDLMDIPSSKWLLFKHRSKLSGDQLTLRFLVRGIYKGFI